MSTPAGASDRPAARSRTRALLEVLRVPLLASPLGDVLAGWLLARGAGADPARPDAPLLWALLAGVSLLAAGMAQNALADAPDDRARKPDRPVPRGDVSLGEVRLVFAGCTAMAVLAAVFATELRWVVGALVLGTAAYHYGLKRWRVPGCLALGGLRALDVCLGVAAAGVADAPALAWGFAGVYGLYVFGASLHASTDDEGVCADRGWRGLGAHRASPSGLALCLAVLLALLVAVCVARPLGLHTALAALTLAWAASRVLGALRAGPPARVTGAALGSLLLLTASVAFALGHPPVGLALVLLMVGSRRLLALFPPS